MDVNGTNFHLIYGPDDWGQLQLNGSELPLAALWQDDDEAAVEWDQTTQSLRLTREIPRFRRSSRTRPLELRQRRGSSRDRYGNWYWIDSEESGLRFLPNGARQSVQFWTAADRAAQCTPAAVETFAPTHTPPPLTLRLRGLAVTTRHYLVVGDVTERGLLLFDLHRGGTPSLLRWPEDTPFEPWDLAPTPDGGLLVLDRENLTYWRLDANFRLRADVDEEQLAPFQPKDEDAPPNTEAGTTQPQGYPLLSGSPPGALSPISIETGPDGNVLILDTNPDRPYSLVYEYRGENLVATYSLENAFEAVDPFDSEGVVKTFSVVGHDFAYVGRQATETTSTRQSRLRDCEDSGQTANQTADEDEGDSASHILYVGERDGKQVIAFRMDRADLRLVDQRDYLPLRRWQGKGLVAAGDQVYYDFADRWALVQVYMECHYAGRAVITTAAGFETEAPNGPFDSGLPGTVWHRLFLDAQIPPGTEVQVRARAADDPELLPYTGWLQQPQPYLRSDGAELPYYDPWADWQADDQPLPERTGTWELLFQGVVGRYLQLELTVLGTGRSTPALRAVRAWYPRFSYLDRYMPAIYRELPDSASFFERWLANFEGFYTTLEEKIEHIAAMFDPRTTPPETLDWLAGWLGLVLDPLWSEERRRFFIRHADKIYRKRGTVPGLEITLRLYLDAKVDERIFDPRCWGQSNVRIVEQFLTRSVGGLVYGDPTDPSDQLLRPLTREDVVASAHRFAVLVPHNLSEEQQAMVERIIELEKPAHTAFELKRYWDLFRVGEARLGLDTQLGQSDFFGPLLLGETYLPEAYLQAAYPFNLSDRIVADRDRLGDLPAL